MNGPAERPAPAPLRLAVEAAESALNRVLALDPEFAGALGALEGRVIALCPEGLGWSLLLRPDARGFALEASTLEAADLEPEADVVVSGPPFSLLAAMTRADADGGFPEAVRIAGEMAVAQRLQRVLGAVEIDWEEQLSRLLGDVAAHEVARAARGAVAWGRDAARRILEQGVEYLTEEARIAVAAPELEEFAAEVEELREQAERLEGRVERLARARGAGRA